MMYSMGDFDHLANPVLASLLTRLRPFARIVETTRAVAARMSFRDLPLGGVAGETRADRIDALRRLASEEGPLALFVYDDVDRGSGEDEIAALGRECGGFVMKGGPMVQMAFHERPSGPEAWPRATATAPSPVDLDTGDYAAMRALVELTNPGPLSPDSPSFGRFLGIRDGETLVAMGGLRCQSDRAAELTLICTHPEYQRRGLASQIVAALVDRTLAEGRRPFLHAYGSNHPAIAAYEKLGFAHTRRGEVFIATGRGAGA